MGVELFKQTLGTDEESVIKKLEKWAREKGDKTFIYYGEDHRSIPIRYSMKWQTVLPII